MHKATYLLAGIGRITSLWKRVMPSKTHPSITPHPATRSVNLPSIPIHSDDDIVLELYDNRWYQILLLKSTPNMTLGSTLI